MDNKLLCGTLLAALMISGGISAQAANLDPVCMPGTLASYEALNSTDPGGCSIGMLNFTNFTFNSSGTGAIYNANDIFLTPATGGFTFTQTSGTTAPPCDLLTTCFQTAAGTTALYDIGYTFIIDPGPQVDSASLGMDPPFGDVSIFQAYCPDSTLSLNSDNNPQCTVVGNLAAGGTFSPQRLTVNDNMPPTSWTTGVVPLVPPVINFADVLTRIDLNGTNGVAGFDAVTGDAFVTDPTPEPFSALLTVSGLVALVFRRRWLAGS
jgi:hypothetical protein